MASKPILETVHETAKGLHKAGVMGVTTMREFDMLCLPLWDSGGLRVDVANREELYRILDEE